MATQFKNKATAKVTIGGKAFNISSNETTAELFDVTNIIMVKTQSSDLVIPGQTLTYTITITNLSLVPVSNVMFEDVIPTGLTYTANSFTVGGIARTPTLTNNTLTYTIASLGIGITIVAFSCTVN